MVINVVLLPFSVSAASKPAATAITSIAAGPGAITVKYKKIKGVTGYEIQCSTSKKFTTKTTKSTKIKKSTTVNKTIKGLNGKKKYYVRIRSYKKTNSKTLNSKWSKNKNITTKASIAKTSITSLTAKIAGLTVKYKKNKNASGYEIQYSLSPTFKNGRTIVASKATTTSKTIIDLNEEEIYYVRVRCYKTIKNIASTLLYEHQHEYKRFTVIHLLHNLTSYFKK